MPIWWSATVGAFNKTACEGHIPESYKEICKNQDIFLFLQYVIDLVCFDSLSLQVLWRPLFWIYKNQSFTVSNAYFPKFLLDFHIQHDLHVEGSIQ